MQEKKDFLILDQQLAGALMVARHRLVTARPDKNDPTKTIFFFSYNERFQRDFDLLKKKKHMVESFIFDLKD